MRNILSLLAPFDAQSMKVFVQTLEVMGLGMLGIFAVTLVIMGTIWLVKKVGEKINKGGHQ